MISANTPVFANLKNSYSYIGSVESQFEVSDHEFTVESKMWLYLPQHDLSDKRAVYEQMEMDLWLTEYRYGKKQNQNRSHDICNLLSKCSKKYIQIHGGAEREW